MFRIKIPRSEVVKVDDSGEEVRLRNDLRWTEGEDDRDIEEEEEEDDDDHDTTPATSPRTRH